MKHGSRRVQATRWIAASRPRTLLLALTPVAAGILLALADTGQIAPLTALGTLLAAAGIQIGTNLHNDAADFERGTDTPNRVGPPRASAQGWFPSGQVRRAAHVAFGIAFTIGLLLVWRGGWPILALGLAAIVSGYAYTSGPRPIACGPFGELYVLCFFGIAAVAGTYYLQTLTLSPDAMRLGVALGLPAAAVLLINNYRDLETDRVAGRRTLCHTLGRPRARRLYAILLLLPMVMIALPGPIAGASIRTWPVLLALPFALMLIGRLGRTTPGARLNAVLGQTAVYQALLVVLLSLGFALTPT